jgi:hypothetical protein
MLRQNLFEQLQSELKEESMKQHDRLFWMVKVGVLAILGGFVLMSAQVFGVFSVSSASSSSQVHLRLLDRLDRPEDGYCVDILGTPGNMRVDVPLFAHNCKPSLTSDSAVVFTSDGLIKFPAVDRCLTVAGVNSRALPGASILLRKCNETIPFFETLALQRFIHQKDGSLSVLGSKLCLTVGGQSAATYSPSHRWRTLFVDDCATAEPALTQWEFVVPRR